MNAPIKHIINNVNVSHMLWALQAHPELWNVHRQRTEDMFSPHHEVDDIWCRYLLSKSNRLRGSSSASKMRS
jgi:hypothetical protein